MRAVGDELREARFYLRDCIGSRDADGVEAMLARGGDERRLERSRVAQKSRLA
jgi:hypothetical protein